MNNDLVIDNPYMNIDNTPKIDPRHYPNLKCKKCGSIVFDNSIIVKNIPGIDVGQGLEYIKYPMPVLVCKNCGQVFEEDVKEYKLTPEESNIHQGVIEENDTNRLEKSDTKSEPKIILT